ncbi:MAG TPA: hypothetical protein VMF70_09790 [Gemmatimonadales bacterium]|nr:hypothetical protein [Gemmatimonadales bacterium]
MQGPSPGEMAPIVIPVFGMLTGLAITGFVVLGPVGRAVGRVLLHLFGVERQTALPAADVAQLRALLEDQVDRLESQQRQLAELAERQDFAERLLAKAREKGLPAGGGGQ